MTIVHDILQQMPAVRQPQRKFLAVLFATILALRGRVTCRNLSRYCEYSERTVARQFRATFDWPDFHQRVMTAALDPRSELISAQDASFSPKSGKQTFGLGHFFNGCARRAERGLEIATLAGVDVTRRCAFTLAVAQTPPSADKAASKQAAGKRPGLISTSSNCGSSGIVYPSVSPITASTVTLRSRNILMKLWLLTSTQSRNCGATRTVCSCIPVRIPSAAGRDARTTVRATFKTSAVSTPSAR